MIKQCTEADHGRIVKYLAAEPEMNLFFFGDLENYGVDTPPVNIFAGEENGQWGYLLLKYFDFYILYSHSTAYNAAEVAEFLQGREVDCLSGKTELLEKMRPLRPGLKIDSTYMCRCNRVEEQAVRPLPAGAVLRRMDENDMDELTDLLLSIEEFSDSYKGPDAWEKSRRSNAENLKVGIIIGVYEGKKLVAAAQTSAANSQSAMIVAVACAPAARGRGYATAAVAELCRQSFAQGKKFLCLFYDNPAAGRIYHRIGFAELGQYGMMR